MVTTWIQEAQHIADTSRALQLENGFFSLETYNPQNGQGFVKHAFILAIYCLIRTQDLPLGEIFNYAMYQTTMLAGDSDTNCAIVGGIIGAYCDIENIDT